MESRKKATRWMFFVSVLAYMNGFEAGLALGRVRYSYRHKRLDKSKNAGERM